MAMARAGAVAAELIAGESLAASVPSVWFQKIMRRSESFVLAMPDFIRMTAEAVEFLPGPFITPSSSLRCWDF